VIGGAVPLVVVAAISLYAGLSRWPTEQREIAFDPLMAQKWLWRLPLAVRRAVLAGWGVLCLVGAVVLIARG